MESEAFKIRAIAVDEARSIRREVLRPERPATETVYPGDDDTASFHLGACQGDCLVGVASFLPETSPVRGRIRDWRLRGMATLEGFRGRGVGGLLMSQGIREVAARNGTVLWCYGRASARRFYEQQGMRAVGDEFQSPITGPHYLFVMELDARNASNEALAAIASRTLRHYSDRAAEFWSGTRDHDVKQNIEALLRHVRGAPPLRILDFGCGPGRDLASFRALGHEPIGLEGSPPLAAMAREHSGCEVWEQNFLALRLPTSHFDGIFANASLFHVPSRELPRVLGELRAALKPNGVLFSSNPRGKNEEGWHGERYGAYYELESWRALLEQAAFSELEYYYRPAGLPREQQPWLASVWRRN